MKKILLALFLFFHVAAAAQRPGRDYAVFFYVTDFKPRWASLPETKTEAIALKKELETNFGFTCEAVPNPNKQTILDKIRSYNDLLTANDQVIFFFSMHGHFEEVAERGYLVAADGLETDEYGASYLSYDDLSAYLARCKAKHVLLALDACHSGAFGTRNRPRPDAPAYAQADDCQQRISKMFQYSGRQYCSSGNKAAKTPAKSLFAARLLEALRTGGEEGLVRFADLEYYLSKVDN
ncbi:MAG: caspase domain-containing protein, partial [Saprospiraceae bacterium]